jgi:hypothetical protein
MVRIYHRVFKKEKGNDHEDRFPFALAWDLFKVNLKQQQPRLELIFRQKYYRQ